VEFLGITGVEDKLQEDIKSTLENLRNADIRIWMLTGDKVETAECISISSGIQSTGARNFRIESVESMTSLKNKLMALRTDLSRVLVIDGKSLSIALDND
jgi:phospholipid-translocating ATPase